MRNNSGGRRLSIAELASMRERGLSQREIARQCGVYQSTVRYWLIGFGMDTGGQKSGWGGKRKRSETPGNQEQLASFNR